MRRVFNIAVLALALGAAGCGDGPSSLTSPSFGVGGGVATNPGGGATVGYTLDAKVLLDGSCTRCHNAVNRSGGVDLSSYIAVLRTVQPGNAGSELIRQSRSGGSMFRYWRGDGAAQAEIIRRWIVEFQARENR